MIRSEILKEIAPILRDQLVVCNIGIPSQELHAIDDQPTNFYMLGTMGLASSIGLGLALAQGKKVISIDGDGSVLTNLGTGQVLQKALDGDQMTIIVCKCESGNAKMPVITMDPVVIKDRFMTSVQA